MKIKTNQTKPNRTEKKLHLTLLKDLTDPFSPIILKRGLVAIRPLRYLIFEPKG